MQFSRSPLTERICNALRGCNDSISWQSLETAAGRPLDQVRGTILNARKYLERDEGIVFASVRGFGLRRLRDDEKIASAVHFKRKIRRTAIRGIVRIDAVRDMASLPNADQLAATLHSAVFRAVQRETSDDR